MPDPCRPRDVTRLTAGKLEQASLELQASLALARPDSPARGPLLAHLSAVDTELAGRQRTARAASPVIYLCSCGFGTDDPDWFDGHQFQHPGHDQRPMARYLPARKPVPLGSPCYDARLSI